MTTSVRKKPLLHRVSLALVAPVAGRVLASGLVVATTGAAQATPSHLNPHRGAIFNNPYGGRVAAHRIEHHIVQTIDSVKRGHKIRIASWNFRSNTIANALIRAHHRGVSVQVIMDYGNWNPDLPNAIARRVHIALSKGDKHRKPAMRSWLRRCHSSCRGHHGISHIKFYAFDKVQKTKDVVMYGSTNATELAAAIQWNDIYTVTKSASKYDFFLKEFNSMKHDKAVKQGYLHKSWSHGRFQIDFYPYRGKGAKGDPVLNALDQVRCTGATHGTGVGGHTKIRIAQTATYGARGIALAHRLATMKQRGCNIRLVYAMFGGNALKIMRAAHVPLTHLAYDINCDGIYDRYLHMKSMTVSGVFGKNTHARITWNGSANWTPVSLASDEVVGRIQKGSVTGVYANWIDYLFTHVPKSWVAGHCTGPGTVGGGDLTTMARARMLKVDPYELIRKDL
jgi:phosphatidylserine/phosphatidylglycerophosphate/cardiolipin synthase-like enzyme